MDLDFLDNSLVIGGDDPLDEYFDYTIIIDLGVVLEELKTLLDSDVDINFDLIINIELVFLALNLAINLEMD